jgi:anti-sigma regulatory factor (Ser/Thr protein kinase)
MKDQPIAPENLFVPHRRGIFLIRQLMDEVHFEFDHGTELRMRRKKLSRKGTQLREVPGAILL